MKYSIQSKKDIYHKKAFTLIEMLIVIVIIGILSILLFRTLADLTRISGRIQFEKILSQNLMNVHTVTSYISERYPHIDMEKYKPDSTTHPLQDGYTDRLYLMGSWTTDTVELFGSWTSLYLKESGKEIALLDEKKIVLTGLLFKILPTEYATGIYNLLPDKRNAEWFWIFWLLYPSRTENTQKLMLNLQHFVHLKP
jgi:prepilin-type N-terminal cleavage/methylation domain-containing protein